MAKGGASFEVTSKGSVTKALLALKSSLGTMEVKVGVFGKADRRRGEGSSRLGNVEIATIHEYGAPGANIPARAPIASTLYAYRTAHRELIAALIAKLVRQELDLKTALDTLGMRVANDIKNRIAEGEILQELAPSTIARKRAKGAWNGKRGESGPILALVDTGQLKNSYTWAVGPKGGGG